MDNVFSILLAIASLPALGLALYVFKKDRIEKEPTKMLLLLMLFGAISCLPAGVLESLADPVLLRIFDPESIPYYIVEAFLVIAVAEEGCKRHILRVRTWKNINFDCSFDAIVYATYVSLGFALLENILYVFMNSMDNVMQGVVTGLMRAVTSVPGHFLFAVFMGLYYGRAKECQIKGDTAGMKKNRMLSFWIPVLLHGTYDAIVLCTSCCGKTGRTVLLIAFVAYVVAFFIVGFKTVKRESAQDRYIVEKPAEKLADIFNGAPAPAEQPEATEEAQQPEAIEDAQQPEATEEAQQPEAAEEAEQPADPQL